jgi:aspartate/methionine/tyrosine aminotransferase
MEGFLQLHRIPFYRPAAGVYIWARLGGACGITSDVALTRLLAEKGVSVGTCSDYSEKQTGWFRLTFALPQEELVEGLRRVAAALGFESKEIITVRETRCEIM